MPKWTQRQLQAITARNQEILVSAAAGSGKTAVLIERVLSLLKEGGQLDKMLVMTFTHAAADEMKERLTDLLSESAIENEHLRAQFALLGRADISTLHSFCMRILRRYFQAADTDPLSRQADEILAGELFSQALDEALDQFYAAPTPADQSLMDRFQESEIILMAHSLHTFLMAKDMPFEWLDTVLESNLQLSLYEHPWYGVMVREAGLLLSGAEDLLLSCIALCERPDGPGRYLAAIKDDLTMVHRLRSELKCAERFTWSGPAFTRFPSKRPGEGENPELGIYIKDNLRDKAKKLVREALSLLPQDEEQAALWMDQVRAAQPQLESLAALVKDTHMRYQAIKAARTLWDFNDLEHLTLKALKDPLVHTEVTSTYDALFVDEYQDISQIQEAIIKRLHGENNTLFMVGDVKQSIYRFRLADPSLFLNKYSHFNPEEHAFSRLITLKENFRSNANILSAVNLVFENAMRADATEIEYNEEARLTTLRQDDGSAPVELWLLEKESGLPLPDEAADELEDLLEEPEDEPSGDGEEQTPSGQDRGEMERAFVYEARLIARRVSELVGTDIEDGDSLRKIQYRDIAVLLRSAANRASVMAEIMGARGIPTYSDADDEFFEQSDIRDVISILEVLDNPCQDIPLLSALACPAFGFSPDELAAIRLAAPERDTPLYESFFRLAKTDTRFRETMQCFNRWRLMAQAMPLERFLGLLLRESGLYAAAGAKEDGRLRRANLRILASRAAPSPEPQNLAGFVERAKRSMKQKTRDRSASLGMQENVVRIMTLHKSKGLQFPVVFLPDLASAFSSKRHAVNLMMDAQTGLALEQIDPVLRTKNEGFGVRAMKVNKNREELSEEARLLYVGMTRARERLILIGAPDKMQGALARWSHPLGNYAAGSARCMLDWVCTPLFPVLKDKAEGLYSVPGGSRWRLNWCPVHTLGDSNLKINVKRLDAILPPDMEAPEDFFRPLLRTSLIPQKSSVTALVSRAALSDQEEETPEVKRRALTSLKPLRSLRDLKKGSELSSAQRGAAAHKVLCALEPSDFVGLDDAALRTALRLALDSLLERSLLLSPERDAVDEEAVARFYQSGLAARMAQSNERHAEWPFTMLSDEQMILQGVLDSCFLEDGAWVLVDYKTDRGEAEELLDRYRPQMRWYMRALREITGQPVKEAWLYLLRQGRPVLVTEDQPISIYEQKTAGAGPVIL